VNELSALILAGGKATRLGGVAKHALLVDGEPILARQARVLAPRVAEILVSCAFVGRDLDRPAAPPNGGAGVIDVPGYRTVRDAVPDAGPLAGIAAGLAAATTSWLLVVAGDMPDLRGEVIDLLCAPTELDATGIRIGGLAEPLLCVLRVAVFRPIAHARLARGDAKVSRLLEDHARVRWLDEAALRAVDPQLRSLRNINTAADYAGA